MFQKKIKHSLSLVLAVLLVMAVFAGCSNSGTPASSAAPAADPASVAGDDGAASQGGAEEAQGAVNKEGFPIMNEDYTFKITHSVGTTDKTGSWEEKEFIKQMREETGLNIELNGISETAYNEQVAIIIASNNMPDAFVGAIPNFAQFVTSFYEITDEALETYAPSIVDYYNSYPDYKTISVFPDGKMYGLPYAQMDGILASKALMINKTWMDAVGAQMPNTPDELLEVLIKFRDEDPNGNGQNDEIPYSFYISPTEDDKAFGLFLSGFGLVSDADYRYLMVEDGKVAFYPSDERFYDYLKFLNNLYTNNLLDPSGFTQEEVDMIAKGSSNLIGLFPNFSYEDITVGEYAEDFEFLPPLADANGNRKYQQSKAPGITPNQFTITNQCPYPEAMLRMYDYANGSFENRILSAWGPEDVAWEWREDGFIDKLSTDLPDGYTSYAEIRHSFSMGVKSFTVWRPEDNAKFAVTTDREIRYIGRQEPMSQYFVSDYIPKGQMDSAEAEDINILKTEIESYMNNFVAEVVMKGIDDAKWEAHVQNCQRMNADKYVELHQAIYDRLQ